MLDFDDAIVVFQKKQSLELDQIERKTCRVSLHVNRVILTDSTVV